MVSIPGVIKSSFCGFRSGTCFDRKSTWSAIRSNLLEKAILKVNESDGIFMMQF